MTATSTLTYLSLFSGGMGGDLAMQHLLGMRCLGYVEIEEYCQKLIRQRQEDGLIDRAPIFTDIRAFVSDGYAASYTGMVDLITGGFPCQDISCAGKGKGITGERSGLWKEMAETIRIVRPRFCYLENSPMLTLRGLDVVLGDLAEMGYDAEWCVLGAVDAGAPHKRERIWIMAHTHGRGLSEQGICKEQPRGTEAKCPGSLREKCIMADAGYTPRPPRRSIVYGCGAASSEGETNRATGQGGNREWRGRSTESGLGMLADGMALRMDRSWPPEPAGVPRVATGVQNRVARLKAIGNGQVPQCAALAWRILSGLGA